MHGRRGPRRSTPTSSRRCTAPVMVVALTGWFDVAGVATDALDQLLADRTRRDGRRDRSRPVLRLHPGAPDGRARRRRDAARSLAGERVPRRAHRRRPRPRRAQRRRAAPALARRTSPASPRWSSDCGCEVVVTVGADADAVPHTRLPLVVGSTADPELARRLGLSRRRSTRASPGWSACCRSGSSGRRRRRSRCASACPTTSATPSTRKSSAALLRHLEHVLGVPLADRRPAEEIDRWRRAARRGRRRGRRSCGPTCGCSRSSTTAAPRRRCRRADDLAAQLRGRSSASSATATTDAD